MVDETSLCWEMYTRICEENGPADPVLRHCLEFGGLLAESGGDLIERSGGLQWLLITYAHTYVTVILIVGEGCQASNTMAAIIRRTERRAQSSFVPRSGGVAE
jgi:hypothetical protein